MSMLALTRSAGQGGDPPGESRTSSASRRTKARTRREDRRRPHRSRDWPSTGASACRGTSGSRYSRAPAPESDAAVGRRYRRCRRAWPAMRPIARTPRKRSERAKPLGPPGRAGGAIRPNSVASPLTTPEAGAPPRPRIFGDSAIALKGGRAKCRRRREPRPLSDRELAEEARPSSRSDTPPTRCQ
jgi:hypothetical protein